MSTALIKVNASLQAASGIVLKSFPFAGKGRILYGCFYGDNLTANTTFSGLIIAIWKILKSDAHSYGTAWTEVIM